MHDNKTQHKQWGTRDVRQDRQYSDEGQSIVSPPESRKHLGERVDLRLVNRGRFAPISLPLPHSRALLRQISCSLQHPAWSARAKGAR